MASQRWVKYEAELVVVVLLSHGDSLGVWRVCRGSVDEAGLGCGSGAAGPGIVSTPARRQHPSRRPPYITLHSLYLLSPSLHFGSYQYHIIIILFE